MTFIEFIKSKLSKDTQLGDLARDIQCDKEFPFDKSEKEIISYLDFKTRLGGTTSTFRKLLTAYKKVKDSDSNQLDVDAKFALLRTENWKFYKEYFPVQKVILVGLRSDFYKAYCIDASNRKALYFDIKSTSSLNDISIVDEESIHIGELTEHVSVGEAITLLENCTYDNDRPDKDRFKELLELLKANN